MNTRNQKCRKGIHACCEEFYIHLIPISTSQSMYFNTFHISWLFHFFRSNWGFIHDYFSFPEFISNSMFKRIITKRNVLASAGIVAISISGSICIFFWEILIFDRNIDFSDNLLYNYINSRCTDLLYKGIKTKNNEYSYKSISWSLTHYLS